MSALETRRDTLYERLEKGYERISEGLDQGRDITKWEDLWLELLNEYEIVCNELEGRTTMQPTGAAPPEQAPLFAAPRRAEMGGR
jgi:hypothetical protein